MYQLTQQGVIIRTADHAFIPPDPANLDYQAYLAWLEEGEETVLIRARDDWGRYVGDDPETEDVNEAYVEVPLEDA